MPVTPFFNKDNARLYAAQGVAARAEAKRKLEELAAKALVQAEAGPSNEFADKTLARVRVQLDLVNTRLTEQLSKPVVDPQAIDRLSNAQMRLAEQERILAGRPLPGSRRPSATKEKPARRDLGATELAPPPQAAAYQPPKASDPNEPNG